MKLKVHYIKDAEGQKKAVKLDIHDWHYIQKLLNKISAHENESVELIETPIEVQKIKTKPKGRHFSDFIMDL